MKFLSSYLYLVPYFLLLLLFPIPLWNGFALWWNHQTVFKFTVFAICILIRIGSEYGYKYKPIRILIQNISFLFLLLFLLYERKFQVSVSFSLFSYFIIHISYLWSDFVFQIKELPLGIYLIFFSYFLFSSFPFFKRKNLSFLFLGILILLLAFTSLQNPERKVSNRTVFDSKPNIDFTIPKLSKNTDIVVFFLEGVGKKDLNLNRSQNFSKKNPVWEVDHFYISVPHSSKSIFTALTGVTQIRETRPNLNPLHLSASLPKILERNGYETIFLFSQPSVFENIDEMAKRLFQIHYDKEKLKSKLNSRYSEFSWGLDDRSLLDFVKNYLPDSEKPMFLWVGFSNTHSPYFVSDSNPFPAENPSDPHSRFLSALQFNLSLVDEMINEITKKRGRDTLFILTSDHGESFGERGFFGHNYSVYNSETLVPFMIRYTKSNERKHFPVGSLSDFKTSLLALFDFPDVGIREEKNFFNKEYKIEHKFKSWNSDSYMGYLEGEKKWIYHSQSDRLFLTDWDETVETELMNRKDKSDFFKRFHKEDP